MRARPFILRCTAILFILVFSQKSGAGLFLHNLLHTGNTTSQVPEQHNNSKELSYSCTCLDDFLMPFDGSEETVYSPPVTNSIVLDIFFETRIPFITSILSSPRGPPASKA
ncbi:MAG TPA: hypothetical protein VK483_00440 [Chitinophagaceae bacterium]|nr:hypothetical protein [Chitinophagaceae bacterium]